MARKRGGGRGEGGETPGRETRGVAKERGRSDLEGVTVDVTWGKMSDSTPVDSRGSRAFGQTQTAAHKLRSLLRPASCLPPTLDALPLLVQR